MSEEKSTESAAPAPSKLPVVFGLLNLLLTAAVLAAVMTRPAVAASPAAEEKAGEHGEAGPAAPGVGPTLKLADFVIHLRNPEAERFAKLSIELELVNELDREKLTPYIPRLRDAFVGYLSDRTTEELAGSEALGRAKAALLKVVEDTVPGKHVRALYFTDFVVQ